MPTSLYSLAITGIATSATFGGLYFIYRASKHSDNEPQAQHFAPALSPVGDKLPILSGQVLLQPEHRQKLIQNLREKLGFSDTAFRNDVLPLLEQFAFYVQQVPASESHHHAHPGGLLDHCLEVADIALRLSSVMNLPPNVELEDRKRLAPVWKYGILVAALLHDLGKTITGMLIDLYSVSSETEGVRWQPEFGAMDMNERYTYYRTSFRDEKMDYALHSQLAWSLFPIVVPKGSSTWINETDTKLFDALRNYLTGNQTEPFYKLIMKSDMESTANNLRHGSRVRFATAKQKPWIEIFMDTLRTMLAEKGGYYSIGKDAGGEVFRHGDLIYIISKTLADNLRKYIHDHKITTLPTDNARIFDTFQEYGASQANPFHPNKSIWDIEVTMASAMTTGKKSVFTMLCFKAAKLYGDNKELWPAEYQGKLNPIDRDTYVFSAKQGLGSNNTVVDLDGFETVSTVNSVEAIDAIETTHKSLESKPRSPFIEHAPASHEPQVKADEQTEQNIDSTAAVNGATPIMAASSLETSTLEVEAGHAPTDLLALLGNITAQLPTSLESQAQSLAASNRAALTAPPTRSVAKALTLPVAAKSTVSAFAAAQKRLAKTHVGQSSNKTSASTSTSASPANSNSPSINRKSGSVSETKNTILPQHSNPVPVEGVHNEVKSELNAAQTDIVNEAQLSSPFLQDDELNQSATTHTSNTMSSPIDMSSQSLAGIVFKQNMGEDINVEAVEAQHEAHVTKIKVQNAQASQLTVQQARNALAIQFTNWLKDGLLSQSIEINNSKAMVHRVEQGLIIMSPKVFIEFTGEKAYRLTKESPARRVQAAIEASSLIHRNKKTAHFQAQTTAISGLKSALITVYLIPNDNMHILFSSPPPINPYIKLVTDEQFRVN